MSEILITGSQSYLGSVLGSTLESKGYSVKGIDTGLIKDCKLYDTQDPPTIYKDVRDLEEGDLKGTRVLVHLAGISNDPFLKLDAKAVYDPTREYTFKVANMCKKMGIKFIFSSSCSVYGRSADFVNEDSAVNPLTPYSVNKVQIEEDLRGITDKDFTPIIFRFATATGLSPRMRFDLAVNAFTAIAFVRKKITLNSDGNAWRPYVAVDDICKAVSLALEYNPYPGEHVVLNVGSTSQNFDLLQITKMLKNTIPDLEIVPFVKSGSPTSGGLLNTYIQDGVDIRDYKVAFERITRELGFVCNYTVEQLIELMIKKYTDLQIDETTLQKEDFYRLKRLERLIKEGKLTEDLKWKT